MGCQWFSVSVFDLWLWALSLLLHFEKESAGLRSSASQSSLALLISHTSYLILTFSQSHTLLLAYLVSYSWGRSLRGGLLIRSRQNPRCMLIYLRTYYLLFLLIYYTCWIHTICLSGAMWSYLEIPEAIWCFLELYGAI